MTTPAGALVDATRHKKLYVIIPGICTVIASGIVLLSQNFWLVTLSQVATAIAGAAIGPGGDRHHARHRSSGRFQPAERTQSGVQPCRQHGRRRPVGPARMACSDSRRAGGWPPLFGVLSIVSVLMIPSAAIDDDEARGLNQDEDENGEVGGFTVLLESQAAADSGRGAGLFSSRQWRHASALRACRRLGQAGRPGRICRDHHRGGARRR